MLWDFWHVLRDGLPWAEDRGKKVVVSKVLVVPQIAESTPSSEQPQLRTLLPRPRRSVQVLLIPER